MSALYRNAALTLLTSRWYENGPLVVLESFSEKTPVVGARIGAIPEFVRDGETGFLFTPNDPDDLRRVIQSALQNPASLDALEENAYRYVCEKHAPALYADRLEHTLQGHLAAQ
jgi:glycosyltransferase involved in cell wall biosynthesis